MMHFFQTFSKHFNVLVKFANTRYTALLAVFHFKTHFE